MERQVYNIQKKMVVPILDEILNENLPLNCTVGKTFIDSSYYVVNITFSYNIQDKDILNKLLEKHINQMVNQ